MDWRIDSGCVDGWVDGEVNEGTEYGVTSIWEVGVGGSDV